MKRAHRTTHFLRSAAYLLLTALLCLALPATALAELIVADAANITTDMTCEKITISAGAHAIVKAGATLTVTEELIVDGQLTVDAGAILVLDGCAAKINNTFINNSTMRQLNGATVTIADPDYTLTVDDVDIPTGRYGEKVGSYSLVIQNRGNRSSAVLAITLDGAAGNGQGFAALHR